MARTARFEELVRQAQEQAFTGWDFSYLKGRRREERPSWDYETQVKQRLAQAQALLDMGTGGGEFLASLQPLPPRTAATEGYAPNVPVARERLAPLGVQVEAFEVDEQLPFTSESFDLIINRHDSFAPAEVYRLLQPGGAFLTQQVGGRNEARLNAYLGAAEPEYLDWCLGSAVEGLVQAGFQIVERKEEFPEVAFHDIGALVYYLSAVPWQIPDFSVDRYRPHLLQLHEQMEEAGPLVVHGHRFYIEAVRP